MKVVNLKYCIEAKNEHIELDNICNCYRGYTYMISNAKVYKVTYCNHWKNYLISNKKCPNVRDVTYHWNSVENSFLVKLYQIIFNDSKDTITTNKRNMLFDINQITYKEILNEDLFFYEPIYYSNKTFETCYNKIPVLAFLKWFEDSSFKYTFQGDNIAKWVLFEQAKNNDFYGTRLYWEYLNQMQYFIDKIHIINKKMVGRKNKLSYLEVANNIFKFNIKRKKLKL